LRGSLGAEHGTEKADPRDVIARPVKAGDKAGHDRVATEGAHNRNRGSGRLGSQDGTAASRRHDHGHLAADQIGRKRAQSIVLVFRKVVFDRHVAAFGVAGFTQPTAERLRKVGSVISPQAGQEADYRHRRLLRARDDRP
jgi:hypothetical protein